VEYGLNVFLGPARKKKSKWKVGYTIDEELNEIIQEKYPDILIILIEAIYDNDHLRAKLCDGVDGLDDQVRKLIFATLCEDSRILRESVLHRLLHGGKDTSELQSKSWKKFRHVAATSIPPGKKVAESELFPLIVPFRDGMSDRRLSGTSRAIKPTDRRAVLLPSPILYRTQYSLPSILLTGRQMFVLALRRIVCDVEIGVIMQRVEQRRWKRPSIGEDRNN
jgi:hypothetical protein